MKKTSPTHDVLCLQQCCKKQALARNKSKAVAPNICKMGLKISLWPLIYSSAPASGSHKLLLGQMPYQLRWQSCWPCRVLPLSLLEGSAAPVEAPHTHTEHTDAQLCSPPACLLLVTPFILEVIFGIAWCRACPGPHTLGILGPSVLTSALLWGWTGKRVKHFSRAVNVINCYVKCSLLQRKL